MSDPEKINDGGPAFPEAIGVSPSGDVYPGMSGMSLRDWFAGLAMQAMASNPELLAVVTSGSILDGSAFDRMAKRAYHLSDAMLAERDKGIPT